MLNKFCGLFLLFGFIGSMAMALNFYGFQSLNGLGTTSVFVAPVSGTYFINGQLTLPQSVQQGNSGYSSVVSIVSKNGVAIYTGSAGATGFQVNQIVCNTADAISVQLQSSNVSDTQNNNAVRGQVSFGNSF